MVEDEIEASYNHWNDEHFIAGLEVREQSFLNGTAEANTITEAATNARESINQANK